MWDFLSYFGLFKFILMVIILILVFLWLVLVVLHSIKELMEKLDLPSYCYLESILDQAMESTTRPLF